MSQRKATSSFIIDSDREKNLMQFSPHINASHLEKSDKNISNNNINFGSYFIAESTVPNNIPRAFSVTKTGEKHSLDLDETLTEKSSASNLYNINSPRCSVPAMERISEKSSSQLSLTEKESKSCIRKLKKAKSAKRFSFSKHRLLSSPRKLEPKKLLMEKINTKDMKKIFTKRNSETQTEENSYLIPGSITPPASNQFTPLTYGYNIPLEGPRNYNKPTLQRQLHNTNFAIPPQLLKTKPIKVHRKYDQNCGKYFALRIVALVFTLITVMFWLFYQFFDRDYLWDSFDNLRDFSQKWFLKKEKPKTKVELFVQFLQDLWS